MVMKQRWSQLLFAHWEVDAAALAKKLPPGLTLDTFEGRAFVGVVPFTMSGVRPLYLPAVRALSDFHETNVRTYVHREGRDPGVWFFSLDAANAVAVKLARAWFKLPYHYARMQLEVTREPGDALSAYYRTTREWPGPLPGRLEARYDVRAPVRPAEPGTLEHFLAERYVLYAYKNEALYLGRVHHAPYPLRVAELRSLDEDLLAAAGLARPDAPPSLVHYAEEVSVDVYALERLATR